MSGKHISFESEFRRRLDDIFSRAEKIGLNITSTCRRSGIARATPDRWRKKTPLTIELVDKLEAEVAAAEKAAGK